MSCGEYALRWKKYQDNLVANLCAFYENRIFTDVTIACDGMHFKAHKLVLAACSPYFEKLFKEHQTDHPIIYLNDVNADYMENIMEFMYKGTTNLEALKVKPFLNLGESLKLKGLTERTASEEHERHTRQQNVPDEDGLSTVPIYTPPTVQPPLEPDHEPELNGPESSGVIDAVPEEQPCALDTPLDRTTGSRKISTPRNAMECVEALMGIDHISSSEDDFLSGSPTASLNQTQHPNLKPINRTRSTNSTTSERQQDNDFDRTMDYTDSPSLMLSGLPGFERQRPNFDFGESSSGRSADLLTSSRQLFSSDLRIPANDNHRMGHMDIPAVAPGEKWFQGRLQFMLSQRGKPLLVHDGHSFGIQYIRKDKKYWQCNLSRKYNCKARVTTTDTGDIIVTNNEHCHTEIRQHLRKDYKTMKLAASLAASRASFAISLALPTQSNPAMDCSSSSTASATNPTITTNDSHPLPTVSGRPDTGEEIRSINLTRMEQVQRLSS